MRESLLLFETIVSIHHGAYGLRPWWCAGEIIRSVVNYTLVVVDVG